MIREGRIRAVAVTSRERMPQLPDVPAAAEHPPLAEYELVNFFGLFAPAGVPEPIMERLHAVVAAALRAPELRGKFEEQGLLVQSMGLAEARAFVEAEARKFGRIVEDAKITVDG